MQFAAQKEATETATDGQSDFSYLEVSCAPTHASPHGVAFQRSDVSAKHKNAQVRHFTTRGAHCFVEQGHVIDYNNTLQNMIIFGQTRGFPPRRNLSSRARSARVRGSSNNRGINMPPRWPMYTRDAIMRGADSYVDISVASNIRDPHHHLGVSISKNTL